jgi:hypothetical protein
MLTRPKVAVMLYRCEICGRPQGKERRVCSACYKAGKSIRGGICADCGVELGAGNRQKSYCQDCRDIRDKESRRKFYAKRKLSGLERYRMMQVALKPMKDDVYAQTHEPISDEEYDAKVRMLRALRAADVHVGSYGHPTRWHFAEQEVGGFGTLANQHMRGGEAGKGTTGEHATMRSMERREHDAARDAGERCG